MDGCTKCGNVFENKKLTLGYCEICIPEDIKRKAENEAKKKRTDELNNNIYPKILFVHRKELTPYHISFYVPSAILLILGSIIKNQTFFYIMFSLIVVMFVVYRIFLFLKRKKQKETYFEKIYNSSEESLNRIYNNEKHEKETRDKSIENFFALISILVWIFMYGKSCYDGETTPKETLAKYIDFKDMNAAAKILEEEVKNYYNFIPSDTPNTTIFNTIERESYKIMINKYLEIPTDEDMKKYEIITEKEGGEQQIKDSLIKVYQDSMKISLALKDGAVINYRIYDKPIKTNSSGHDSNSIGRTLLNDIYIRYNDFEKYWKKEYK